MLLVRDVIRFKATSKSDRALLARHAVPNESEARIVWLESQTAWLVRLGTSRLMTWSMPAAELERMKQTGAIELIAQHAYDHTPTNDEMTETQKSYRDVRYRWIEPLLHKAPDIFERTRRCVLVAARAEELADRAEQRRILRDADEGLRPLSLDEQAPDRRTLNGLLRRYWVHGMTPNAVMPRFDRIGCNSRDIPRQRKVQRSRAGARLMPFVTPEWRKTFEQAISRHYRTNAQRSLKRVWLRVVDEATTRATMDYKTNQITVVHDEDKRENAVPTYRQFLYWYRNSNRYLEDKEQRMGSARFLKSHRAITGSALTNLFGVGSRFEVDATMLDISCVSRNNRNRLVGRPTLHLVTDVYSKMIVGFYLGFLNSSWEVAGLALRNVMENKKAFCARYGVEIEEDEWPVSGCLPYRILGDRGEYEGYNATDFTARTGVTVEVTAPYRGDMKGTVEKRFHMIHQIIKSETPGAVAKNHAEKGDVDYRRTALFNLDELTKIIIHTILYLNNHHVLHSYRRGKAMAEGQVPAIPREIWNWALRTGRQQLRRVSNDRMKILVLPELAARITGEGLVFKSLRYRSEWVHENNLATLKRTGRAQVSPIVSYDPNSTNRVYLHLEDGQFEECELSEVDERFSNMTFTEVEKIRTADREERRRLDARDSVAFGQLHRHIAEVRKSAGAERPGDISGADLKHAAETREKETKKERDDRRKAEEEARARGSADQGGGADASEPTGDPDVDLSDAVNRARYEPSSAEQARV